MCIIVMQPHGKEVSRERLAKCWEKNPHGGGFMYTDGNRVQTVKELRSFDHYWKHLQRHVAVAAASKSPIVHHFRWATHGAKDIRNCHPFLVDSRLGVAHNGVFSWIKDDKKYSDTYIFNRDILKPLPKGFIYNPAIVTLLDDYVGFNKLVFLDVHGNHLIINENSGTWDEGVWYSNTNYKESTFSGRCKSSECNESWGGKWVTVHEPDGKWVQKYLPTPSDSYGDYAEWWEGSPRTDSKDFPTVPTRLLPKADGVVEDDETRLEIGKGEGIECDYCGQDLDGEVVLWAEHILHPQCKRELMKDIMQAGKEN